ncbi:MAG: ATP-dependent helicase HrpB [Hyphomicrobium sp.]
MLFDAHLPIDEILDPLRSALLTHSSVVLIAPPGAGKTTRVPLALLQESWLHDKKIILLEPRRLAARSAAERMSQVLKEKVGERIGLQARLMSKNGPSTRIEVVTEGVFTRRILENPLLEGIGAVLFDEFHERSLDADLGLALALDCQKELRPDLRLLIMSATLDGARIANKLQNAKQIVSEGRCYPIKTRYLGRDSTRPLEDQVVKAIQLALNSETGSLLVFLPGQGEIRRVEQRLQEILDLSDIFITPLYGAMELASQDRALEPAPSGKRKIVLATSIAETSLTIEGVRVVIDSGVQRHPTFEPGVGFTRLETVRVSQASADQRRGRAGRTEPGVCYRLWDEQQTASLKPFADPEIQSSDLSGLLLDCAEWGVTNPQKLVWLDPPSTSAIDIARQELREIGAMDEQGCLTEGGRQIRKLPLPPRLARMILSAATHSEKAALHAAEISAVLVERGLGGQEKDLDHRLENFQKDGSFKAKKMRRLAKDWAQQARNVAKEEKQTTQALSTAFVLAFAYPERFAKARGKLGQFLLANGRGAYVEPTDPIAKSSYLVIGELQGGGVSARILLAACVEPSELLEVTQGRLQEQVEVYFDPQSASVKARSIRRIDSLVLSSETKPVLKGPETSALLIKGLAQVGLERLPWTKDLTQFQQRVAFLRAEEGGDTLWPDLSNTALLKTLETWLLPYLTNATCLTDITPEILEAALKGLLPWEQLRKLDIEAPTHFVAPTGNRHSIDYEDPQSPTVSLRVQEVYGVKINPSLGSGQIPLTLNLLSPAHRPLQITRDLQSFWKGAWSSVKSEMKGRYPRHPWPDDPANALPTARAKPRNS